MIFRKASRLISFRDRLLKDGWICALETWQEVSAFQGLSPDNTLVCVRVTIGHLLPTNDHWSVTVTIVFPVVHLVCAQIFTSLSPPGTELYSLKQVALLLIHPVLTLRWRGCDGCKMTAGSGAEMAAIVCCGIGDKEARLRDDYEKRPPTTRVAYIVFVFSDVRILAKIGDSIFFREISYTGVKTSPLYHETILRSPLSAVISQSLSDW
jgi:hypothetical protein